MTKGVDGTTWGGGGGALRWGRGHGREIRSARQHVFIYLWGDRLAILTVAEGEPRERHLANGYGNRRCINTCYDLDV
jgi:hypothetical protein